MQRENILVKWVVSTVAIYFAAWLLPGIEIDNFWNAGLVALIMALVNVVLKPLLILISLPLIVFSLGFFLLVINAVLLMFADEIVDSFHVDGFWSALVGSLVISLATYLLNPPRRGNGGPGNGNGPHITITRFGQS